MDTGSTSEISEEASLDYVNFMLRSQLNNESDSLANLANSTSIIFSNIERLNWVGYYILKSNELVLGPFQGKPACNRIEFGEGVCGTSWKEKRTILVEDVTEFKNHIVCDINSKSELVIPIIVEGKFIGVLDIDSPDYNRFGDLEKKYFEKFVDIIKEKINWTSF